MLVPSVIVLIEMAERNPNIKLNNLTTFKTILLLSVKSIEMEVHKQRNLGRLELRDGKYGGYRKDFLKRI